MNAEPLMTTADRARTGRKRGGRDPLPGSGTAFGGRPLTPVLLLAGVVAVAAILLIRFRGFYHDDAYITLRYVARLLSGRGLTFNDGERVEGFTHPLWLIQIALAGLTGIPLVTATRILGAAYFAALLVLWRRARLDPLFLLLLISQGGLILWTWGGLETVSFCFWIVAGTWLITAQRAGETAGADGRARSAEDSTSAGGTRPLLAGAAFAAAGLTRPEGIGVGFLALVLLWLAERRRFRKPLLAGVVFLAPLLIYELFRLAWFGDLLAASARAKVEGIPLGLRLSLAGSYLARSWNLWIPAACVCLGTLLAGRRAAAGESARSAAEAAPASSAASPGRFSAGTSAPALSAAARAALLSIPLWLGILAGGGDHMPGARLILPALCLLALAGALAAPALSPRGRRILLAAGLVVTAGQLIGTVRLPVRRDTAAELGGPVGRFLSANLPPGAVVAASTAGSTPFHAPDLTFIDMLGLNDRVIARRRIESVTTKWQRTPGHLKGDGAYVLSRRPDAIILGPSQGTIGTNPRAWFLSDYELLGNPGFRSAYTPFLFLIPLPADVRKDPALAPLLAGPDLQFVAWLRRDSERARTLAARGREAVPPWGGTAPR